MLPIANYKINISNINWFYLFRHSYRWRCIYL
jgi:hypothetical protein